MQDATLNPLLLSIAMIAVFALIWGGIRTLKTDRTRGVLMIVAAAVILGNLLIWSI
jgi:hypothetical protein